ncbi:ImmA/IrrE family metallo-endopeptidase [Dactylosporangium sp. NPDC048998]|uniref:ImmA/IrrE family metallo-endopeptidase n=1 Tax=Dactylosporangium sp. NPDC048998 TaxID=3363976 RepID=UPI00371D04F9
MSRYSDDALVLTLVREAGAVLDGLGLAGTFTLAELHTGIERRRGRPIEIRHHPMPPEGPHGLWVMGETADYVFVDESAPPLRRTQIIGHEFGHMLFDDRGDPLPGEPALHACARSGYDEMIEQRCEWFGTVVLQRLRD